MPCKFSLKPLKNKIKLLIKKLIHMSPSLVLTPMVQTMKLRPLYRMLPRATLLRGGRTKILSFKAVI